ncbi:OpgC protein [Bartonella clarridgeiae 73]|uniref:OpgC protein n=1 Tax=Bartonella clarridgeiae (strain CCUG 45776 / CIP 104772 / 73) TaxID=696125 RepID=E6YJ61_BARC7|nr:OpgC domain-containing protein [Bartonella clarridgeiae]WCR55863.1 MAG: OpgC protein [Bartonella clarridgeiae]CBI76899.1 OpgC protein [Bartonella clarridgeiae 73]
MTCSNTSSHHSPHTPRDTRIDVCRSLALLTIFINHIPGTFYEHLTHKNFGFSDSAEIFVLLSGISLGISFHTRWYRLSFSSLSGKLWQKAFRLYKAYLFTNFITLGLFWGAFSLWNLEQFTSMNNVGLFFTKPFLTFLSILSFGHQLGYNNILSLYIVLMIFAPFALYLSCRHKGLLLFISFILYFLCGLYRIAPPSYPLQGQWFLNPLSWQFLFVIGFTTTLFLKEGKPIPFCRPLLAFSVIYLVFSLLWVRLNWWESFSSLHWSSPLIDFNKTFLSLPRLLHILSLSFLIFCLPCLHQKFCVSTHHPLAILGKQSLPVFVTGTLFAMCGQILKTAMSSSFMSDTLLIISGISLQFVIAYYYENKSARHTSL